jgi:hypothetical protein
METQRLGRKGTNGGQSRKSKKKKKSYRGRRSICFVQFVIHWTTTCVVVSPFLMRLVSVVLFLVSSTLFLSCSFIGFFSFILILFVVSFSLLPYCPIASIHRPFHLSASATPVSVSVSLGGRSSFVSHLLRRSRHTRGPLLRSVGISLHSYSILSIPSSSLMLFEHSRPYSYS